MVTGRGGSGAAHAREEWRNSLARSTPIIGWNPLRIRLRRSSSWLSREGWGQNRGREGHRGSLGRIRGGLEQHDMRAWRKLFTLEPASLGFAIRPTINELLESGRDNSSEETNRLLETWGQLHAVRSAVRLVATRMSMLRLAAGELGR